jgi:diacylglycerol kinase (ATP)
MTSVFVVWNPAAGRSSAAGLRRALKEHFGAASCPYQVHELAPAESIADTVRQALRQGFGMCIAAGGDGTVSGVASGLACTEVPLGIVPLGTGNTLAREMGIPLQLERALNLLVGSHTTHTIDAMRVGDQYYTLAVGAGISGWMMRDTPLDAKRRFGRVSYVWTGLRRLFGWQPARFDLVVDGRSSRVRATEVHIANCGAAGDPHVRWGSHVRLDDGRLDVCIVRARTILDYLRLVWGALFGGPAHDPNLRFLTARQRITIGSKRPLPVQGDGEFIGHTPVDVELVPGAVRLIVPAAPGQMEVRSEVEMATEG